MQTQNLEEEVDLEIEVVEVGRTANPAAEVWEYMQQ